MNIARKLAVLPLVAFAAVAIADDDPDPVLRELLRAAASEADSFEDHYAAEVWLTDMSTRLAKQVADPEERIDILRHVHYEASRVDLAPELVLAVIDVESNFDRYAVSFADARGLMQVRPFWLAEIGRPNDNLLHVHTNLRMGCTILRYYMDMEHNDLVKALSRYNGSRGDRKYADKVLDKLRKKWFRV